MPLDKQHLDIVISGGLAENIDARILPQGSALQLDNAVFSHQGSIQKRLGYGIIENVTDDGNTLSDIVGLASHSSGTLYAATRNATPAIGPALEPSLYAFRQDTLQWRRVGSMHRYAVDTSVIVRQPRTTTCEYSVLINGIKWYFWVSYFNTSVFGGDQSVVMARGVKASDGTVVFETRVIYQSAGDHFNKAFFANDGGNLVAFVVSPHTGSSGNIVVHTFDVTTFAVTNYIDTGTSSLVVNDMCQVGANGIVYAAVNTGLSLVSLRSFDLATLTFGGNTSFVISAGTLQVVLRQSPANSTLVAVGVNDTNNRNLYVAEVGYTVPALSIAFPAVVVGTYAAPAGHYNPSGIAVYYSPSHVTSGQPDIWLLHEEQDRVEAYGCDSLGTPYPRSPMSVSTAHWAYLGARPFTHNGVAYAPLLVVESYVKNGSLGPSVSLCLFTPEINSADAIVGASTIVPNDMQMAGVVVRGRAALLKGATETLPTRTGIIDPLPLPYHDTTNGIDVFVFPFGVQSAGGGARPDNANLDEVRIDFGEDTEAGTAYVEVTSLLATPGGGLTLIDGQSVFEAGYVCLPDSTGGETIAANANGLVPGVYQYAFCYAWRDATGNVHRSAPSFKLVDLSGEAVNNFVTFDIRGLSSNTRKGIDIYSANASCVTIEVYRTVANGAGTHYRITADVGDGALLDASQESVTFTDTFNDGTMLGLGFGTLYTDGGTLENVAPPATRAMCLHDNRLWLASSEDEHEIWYSKFIGDGDAPGFNEILTLRVDAAVGPITALASLDDKLVVFTATQIFYFSGDGPNDTGNDGTGSFVGPQRVQAESGCVDARTIASFSSGVVYQSQNGMMLMSRAIDTQYIGASVKDTVRQLSDIRGACVDAANMRAYWIASDPVQNATPIVLCYDYEKNAWSKHIPQFATFFANQFIASAMWQGRHVFVGPQFTNRAFAQAYGPFLGYDYDGVIQNWVTLTVATPWIKTSGVSGFQRVWRATATVTMLTPNQITLQTYADYNDGFATANATFDSFSLDGLPIERVQVVVARQKCSAVKVVVQDFDDGSGVDGAPTGFDLSTLGLDIGVKPGSARLGENNKR